MDEARKTGMDLIERVSDLQDGNAWPSTVELIVDLRDEVLRLREKCDKQAMVIRRIYAEHLPDTWFVCGELGEKDRNNLPKYIEVCPAYGVDWSQIYERTDRTIGGMGS